MIQAMRQILFLLRLFKALPARFLLRQVQTDRNIDASDRLVPRSRR
jgi:hypothetical protein